MRACATFGFDPAHIVPHGSYLINLGSSNSELAAKSYTAFLDGMPLVWVGTCCCGHPALAQLRLVSWLPSGVAS